MKSAINAPDTTQQEIGIMANRLSNCAGLVIGTAVGLAITLYGASEVVASGLRTVFL